MSIYRRVLRYYRPFLGPTALGLVLSLCGIGLNLLKPWPFKIIVDDILPGLTKSQPHSHLLDVLLGPGTRTFSTGQIVGLLCLALVLIQLVWGAVNWLTIKSHGSTAIVNHK